MPEKGKNIKIFGSKFETDRELLMRNQFFENLRLEVYAASCRTLLHFPCRVSMLSSASMCRGVL